MEDILILIKDVNKQEQMNEFVAEVKENMFRNKNKKVHEIWSTEKILKAFAQLRDINLLASKNYK